MKLIELRVAIGIELAAGMSTVAFTSIQNGRSELNPAIMASKPRPFDWKCSIQQSS